MESTRAHAQETRAGQEEESSLRSRFTMFGLGFLSASFFWAYYRYLNSNFPINIVALCISAYSLSGVGFGILLNRLFERRAVSAAMIALLMLFTFSTLVFMNVTTSYLLGDLYYPFPKPPHSHLHLLMLSVSIILSPCPLVLAGMAVGRRMRETGRPLRICSLFNAGVLLAIPVAHLVIYRAGVLPIFIASLLLLVLYLGPSIVRVAAILAVLASTLCLLWKNDLLFTWGVSDYKLRKTEWSIYYRLDFITFDEDRCLGVTTNKIIQQVICPQKIDEWMLFWPRTLSTRLRLDSALVIGRADGNIPRWVKLLNPDFKSITAVDYEPGIVKNLTGEFSSYTRDIFDDPRVRVISSDLSDFLKKDSQKYDLIWLNGIGIRQFLLPKTIIPQENFIFTDEVFRTIFLERLSEGGLVLQDWGSSRAGEFYPLVANVPPGFHSRVFWMISFFYPFVGLPLFISVSSKDAETLADIARSITRVSAFTEVPVDPGTAWSLRSSENRPWDIKGYGPMLVLCLPVLIALSFLASMVRRRMRLDETDGRYFFYLFAAAGLGCSCCEVALIARNARLLGLPIPIGSIFIMSLFQAGYTMSMLGLALRHMATRSRGLLLSAFVAGGSLIASQFSDIPVLLMILALAAGAGCGHIFGSAIAGMKDPSCTRAFGIERLGASIGLLMFQFLFTTLGLFAVSVVSIFFFLALAFLFRIHIKSVART